MENKIKELTNELLKECERQEYSIGLAIAEEDGVSRSFQGRLGEIALLIYSLKDELMEEENLTEEDFERVIGLTLSHKTEGENNV